MNTDKIFGHTREELVEMFEPLSEYWEKVNDITTEKARFGTVITDADYKKNAVLWLSQRIADSKMSKADKEYVNDMINWLINACFDAGRLNVVKEYGDLDATANEAAERLIKKRAEENIAHPQA